MSSDEELEYSSDPKVVALEDALKNRDPFCTGICPIRDHQRILHYTDESALQSRRIDYSNAGSDVLDALYRAASNRAGLGRKEKVSDESYRKAGKMGLHSFSTPLDPCSLGIHEQVSRALLTDSGHASMDMELYELNVFGKGDHFKAHKVTQRGEHMFGTLIIVLPTVHEGGQFVLRRPRKKWTIDFTDKFASATEPSVCFIAFNGKVEHEVLPINSGYRITLTYNLYNKPIHSRITTPIPTPSHLNLRRALADLVNDTLKLSEGGYFGFGLVHEYVHTGRNLVEPLLGQLKGSDRALVDACNALGLGYSIRLLYRNICSKGVNLLTTEELDVSDNLYEDTSIDFYIENALEGLSHEQVEGVFFVEQHWKPDLDEIVEDFEAKFCKSPVMEVLEVTSMKSSVDVRSPVLTTGRKYEPELEYFYGTACLLIAVEPAESRHPIEL